MTDAAHRLQVVEVEPKIRTFLDRNLMIRVKVSSLCGELAAEEVENLTCGW